jgi:predicted TIM-barrel fold metal-dependent hydrolase
MGSHALWRDVEEVLVGLPIYLDTSYSHYVLGDESMARFISRHGAENVLFGTDSPWKKADDEISRIKCLPLPASDIELILSQNAERLLA